MNMEYKIDLQRFNAAIKTAAKQFGLYKKSEIAEFLGYNPQYFSGIINGKEEIRGKNLKNISEKLNIDIAYLRTGDGEMLTKNAIIENSKNSVAVGDVKGDGSSKIYIHSNNDGKTIAELIKIIKEKDDYNGSIVKKAFDREETSNNRVDELIKQNRMLIEKLLEIKDKE